MKKKYIAIITAFIVVILAFTLTRPKNSNLIYEFDGVKVSAEEYYEILLEKYGYNLAFQYIERTFLATLDVSDDIKSASKLQAQAMVNKETSDEEKDSINTSLIALGYSGIKELELFLTHSNIRQEIIAENVSKYIDVNAAFDTLQSRKVTHVLVVPTRDKEDHLKATSPTKEEESAMNKVDNVLKDSDNIRLEMIKISNGETIIGENLGYVDKNSPLVEPFLSETLKMRESTTSGWVKTSFGYHRIYVESTNVEEIAKSEDFVNALLNYDESLAFRVILGEMKDAGVTMDKTFETNLLESMGG